MAIDWNKARGSSESKKKKSGIDWERAGAYSDEELRSSSRSTTKQSTQQRKSLDMDAKEWASVRAEAQKSNALKTTDKIASDYAKSTPPRSATTSSEDAKEAFKSKTVDMQKDAQSSAEQKRLENMSESERADYVRENAQKPSGTKTSEITLENKKKPQVEQTVGEEVETEMQKPAKSEQAYKNEYEKSEKQYQDYIEANGGRGKMILDTLGDVAKDEYEVDKKIIELDRNRKEAEANYEYAQEYARYVEQKRYKDMYDSLDESDYALLDDIINSQEASDNANLSFVLQSVRDQEGTMRDDTTMYTEASTKAYEALKAKGYTEDEITKLTRYRLSLRNAEISKQHTEESKQFAKEHPLLASGVSVMTNLASPVAIVEPVRAYMTDTPVDPNSSWFGASQMTSDIRQTVQDENDLYVELNGKQVDIHDEIYNATMSTADSLLAGTIMPGLGLESKSTSGIVRAMVRTADSMLGGSLVGGQAMASAMQDVARRGGTPEEVIKTGLFHFFSETVSEAVSLGNFKALQSSGKKGLINLGVDLLKNAGVNASEEMVTEAANIVYDKYALGDISNFELNVQAYMQTQKPDGTYYTREEAEKLAWKDAQKQIREAGQSGFVQGLISGAPATVSGRFKQNVSNASLGQQLKQSGQAEAIVKEARQSDDKAVQEWVQRINKTDKTTSQLNVKDSDLGGVAVAMADKNEDGSPNLARYFPEIEKSSELTAEEKAEISKPTLEKEGGKVISVASVENVSDGKVEVKDSKGETRELDVNKLDGVAKELWSYASKHFTEAKTVESFINSYDGENVETYSRVYKGVFDLASTGMTANRIKAEGFYDLDALNNTAFESAVKMGHTAMSLKAGMVDLTTVRKSKSQKLTMKIADAFGKRHGLNIVFIDSMSKSEGFYTESKNQIVIAMDTSGGAIARTLGHETFHYVKANNHVQAQEMSKFVMDTMTRLKGAEWVEQQINNYASEVYNTREKCEDEFVADQMFEVFANERAVKEFVAKDRNFAQKVLDHIRSVISEIKAIYDKLVSTGHYDDIAAWREDMDALQKLNDMMLDALRNIEQRKAYEEGSQPIADNEIITDGATVTESDGTRYSLRSMRHDIAEGKMFDDLKTYCGFTEKQTQELKSQLEGLVEYMTPYRETLDLNETYGREGRKFSPYKPNSDPLYTISLDFSTQCSKRLLTQYVIEQLQLRENRPMNPEEQMAIRDMLKEYGKVEKGLQVACVMCYVEAARLKSPKQINRWLTNPEPHLINYFAQSNKDYKAKVEKAKEDFKISRGYDAKAVKKDMKPADVKALNLLSTSLRAKYIPTAEERAIIDTALNLPNSTYLTAGNLADLSETHPVIYKAYTSFIRTATRSKALETDEPYYYGDTQRDNGNGVVVTDSFIKAVNKENGMRFSSWSDWQIQHLLDWITAVIDNSVRGASMHGYTKYGDEVRVLGKTGMMFNLSGVAGTQNGLNEDGSLNFSDTESVDINDAIQLREEFPETAGLQCIGVSKEHIRALLRSNIIDYVIPYHVSGLNASLRRMGNIYGWTNFTSTQHATEDKSASKENAIDSDNWHKEPVFSEFFVGYDTKFNGTEAMRQSAENYKRMCAERGLIPKFNEFTDEADYWKLLIDRKMVNQKTNTLIKQKAVTPTFDFDVIKQIVDKHVANYDKGLEQRAFNHIAENWDSIPQRIRDLKKQGATKKKSVKKSIDTLANETVAVQPKEIEETETQYSTKREQLEIINETNPAPNAYSTWIRSVDDIKTLPETLEDTSWDYEEFTPDLTRTDIKSAIRSGEITVYSSYPIENGVFVSPSKMEAESYSGNGKVYQKTVNIGDVAWIDPTQGQFAKIDEDTRHSSKNSTKREYSVSEDASNYILDSKEYQEIIDIVDQRYNLTNKKMLSPKAIDRLAGRLLSKASSKYDREQLTTRLTALFDYMANSNELDWEDVMRSAAEVSYDILKNSSSIDRSMQNQYRDTLDYLKGLTVYISPEVKAEIKSRYGSLDNYRRVLGNRVKLTTTDSSKVSLDSLWKELNEYHPEMFGEEVGYLDQPEELATFFDIVKPKPVNQYELEWDIDEASYDFALQIYDEYFNIPEVQSQSRRHQLEMERLKGKYNAQIADIRRGYKERMKAIRDDRDAKINALRKENREAYEKLRTTKNAKIEETKELYRQRNKDYRDKRNEMDNRRKLRRQVLNTTKKLTDLLVNPSDKKHIPQELIVGISSFAKAMADHGAFSAQRAANLQRAFRNISENATDPDFNIASMYDDEIATMLEDLVTKLSDKRIGEMTSSELRAVNEIAQYFSHVVTMSNRAFSESIRERLSDLQTEAYDEISAQSKDKKRMVSKLNMGLLKPVTFFEVVESKTLEKLYTNIRNGEQKWAKIVTEAKQKNRSAQKEFGYKAWADDKVEITTERGDKLSLTVKEALSIYATSRREQGVDHIMVGGIVLEEDARKQLEKKNKLRKNKDASVNVRSMNVPLTMGDIQTINSKLTKDQKAYADEMVAYMSNDMANLGNEVSMRLYGIRKYNEAHYFPLKSASNFLYTEPGVESDTRIKHMSMTKRTVPKANNPVMIDDFSKTVMSHCQDMALYSSFALSLEDFKRVWNYKTPSIDQKAPSSIKQQLDMIYGSNANRYIKQLLTDINGGVTKQAGADYVNKMIGLAKKSSVFASLSVAVQQPSALARSMAYIDPKYFVGIQKKGTWEEIKKYAPVAIVKEMGYFDTGIGRQAVEWMNETDYEGLKEKAFAFFRDSDYRDDKLSFLPAFMDEITWGRIWVAVKNETKSKYPELDVKSEEFLEKCGERFTYVIDRTQVYDSVFSRSEWMRSKDTGVKVATAFMSEPLTSYNMLYNAAVKLRHGDVKFATKTVAAYIASVVLNSALKSFVLAARDDDEEKSYWEKYLANLVSGITGEPFDMIPYFKDLISLIQGYDSSRMDTQAIADLAQASQTLLNANKTPWEKVRSVLNATGMVTGLPIKNIIRDTEMIVKGAEKILSGEYESTTNEGIKNAILESYDSTKYSILDVPKLAEQVIEALINGDTEHYNKQKKNMLEKYNGDTKEVKKQLNRTLGEMYKEGKIDRTQATRFMRNTLTMKQKDIDKKFKDWEEQKKAKEDE